jgi:hypothetical protein
MVGVISLTLPALTACDGDSNAAPPPTPTVSPQPTATPSTPPPDPRKTAEAGAIAGLRRWDAEIFRMEASGGVDVSMLPAISVGTQLTLDRSRARQIRALKIRATKAAKIISVSVSKVGPPNATGLITRVSLKACVDVTTAVAVDASGKSVVPKNRPPRQVDTADMQLVGQTWKVAMHTNEEARSC